MCLETLGGEIGTDYEPARRSETASPTEGESGRPGRAVSRSVYRRRVANEVLPNDAALE